MRDQKSPHAWPDTLPSQFGPYDLDEVPESHRAPVEAVPAATEGAPPAPPTAAPAAAAAPERLAGARWLLEGLRASVLKRPRTGAAAPAPGQAIFLVLLCSAVLVGLERLHIPGPAVFHLGGWLTLWWSLPALLGAAWWALSRLPAAGTGDRLAGGVPAWLVLSTVAVLPASIVAYGLMALGAHDPARWSAGYGYWAFWAIYGVTLLWDLLVQTVLMARFTRSRGRTAVFVLVLLAVTGGSLYYMSSQSWVARTAASEGDAPPPARLHLSQSVFEDQQDLMQQQAEALVAERPGVTDVYALVFAPYASENVFRRESTMVSQLLQERFDAQGRVLHLLNHAETTDTHAWATPENLERAVHALAARMDKDNDLLVVYMTSHGARNHQLAASHWPLEVAPTTPEMLREVLDAAGIRHRVIAISACYSGGWIDTLANPSTLIMTAADATHTSYGCGALSELTFFGRAVFDEQLRSTHSFEEAFKKAVPLIQRREVEAGKNDGFSNPQIRVGAEIAPVLKGLEERLNATPR